MKLLVVDGNSILNRAFYGIKPLTTKDGRFTNAIYGFMTMFERMKADVQPDAVAIAFDLKAKTFRHEMYDLYKANRKGMPEELHQQMAPLKELLTLLGYKLVTCEGFEADDILGTLSKAAADSGSTCVIATGDRDSLQLVNERVSVRLCKNLNGTMLYTPETVQTEYGVAPRSLIEVKAIQGDSSDNIPGVAGIGPKGATELISKYGSIHYIYEHLDELDIRPNMKAKLEQSKDSAFLSRKLGEICLTAPVDTNLESYIPSKGDRAAAARRARIQWVMEQGERIRQEKISRSQAGTIQSLCEKAMAQGGDWSELQGWLKKNLKDRGARHGDRFTGVAGLIEQTMNQDRFLSEEMDVKSNEDKLKLLCLLFDFSRKAKGDFSQNAEDGKEANE